MTAMACTPCSDLLRCRALRTLARALPDGETLGDGDGEEAARAMGAAIVGCEEMQAIKAVLRRQGIWQAADAGASARDVLRLLGLPDVVVEWVLS